MAENKLMVGGQAVIEGVMMRTPEMVTVACRRADGSITVLKKPYRSLLARNKILALPILRGAIVLVEALVLGVQALAYSGELAEHDQEPAEDRDRTNSHPGPRSKSQSWRLALALVSALGLGLAVFFYIPLLLTEWLGAETGVAFNVVDGVIRLAFFLGYVWLISRSAEIRRVFEYHGAEHKSIFNHEAHQELIPINAARFSRFHPRCGTSFLLIVMLVSILVFMLFGKPNDVGERLMRLSLIPLIGGISYELIRLSDVGYRSAFWIWLIAPGLWLQRLTTREPDHGQLEVAIVALKAALGQEMTMHPNVVVDDGKAVLREAA